MTNPHPSDRAPIDWEARALAERTKDLPRVRERTTQIINPWMVLLTLTWIVLLIVSGTIKSAAEGRSDDPAVLITLLCAAAVALAQVVVLALRWEPRP